MKLGADEQALLREIVSKHLADDAERLLQEPAEKRLSPLRVRVREAVGIELVATGFDSNDEPKARGLVLEGPSPEARVRVMSVGRRCQ